MWRSFYENAELLELPILSMFAFAVMFVAAAVFAWRKRDDGGRASLPLSDDDGRTS